MIARSRLARAAAAILLMWVPSAMAAVRLPVPDGSYCGPGAATIGIDSPSDTVAIDGYACGSPVFAADELQSIQCSRDGGPPKRREFDVRVLNGALLYNGRWFRPCR